MTPEHLGKLAPSGTSCRVTPSGFDVTTASPDELALYGIPPRPDPLNAPTEFAMWSTAFKKGFKLIKPELRVSSRRHAPVQGFDESASTSNNWAGSVLTNFAPLQALFVAAQWQVQWVWPGSGPFPQYLASWIGMDGFDNTDVLQAGVDQLFDGPAETTNLWYEWYPADAVDITNLPVNPGDTVTCLVNRLGDVPADATVVFTVNGTAGVSIFFKIPDNTTFFGSSAEFIVERPTLVDIFGNKTLAALPAYVDVVFSQMQVTLSDGTIPNLQNNAILVTMADQDGAVLSVPSVGNPTTLTVFPPAPVKTFEKGPREKDGEKGHHVIENLPIMSDAAEPEGYSGGTRETFITQQDRPSEGP